MYVEENRRAFLHVRNFKIFVDELYWVRLYENQAYYLNLYPQTKMFIKIPYDARCFTKRYMIFEQPMLRYIQTSAVQLVYRELCDLLGIIYLLVHVYYTLKRTYSCLAKL